MVWLASKQFPLYGWNDLTAYTHLKGVANRSGPQPHHGRPTYLMSLLDPQGQIGTGKESMLQEIRTEERGPISRRRVFAYSMSLEEEPGAQVILGVTGFAAEEVNEARETFIGQRGKRLQIKPASSQGVESAQWDDQG